MHHQSSRNIHITDILPFMLYATFSSQTIYPKLYHQTIHPKSYHQTSYAVTMILSCNYLPSNDKAAATAPCSVLLQCSIVALSVETSEPKTPPPNQTTIKLFEPIGGSGAMPKRR